MVTSTRTLMPATGSPRVIAAFIFIGGALVLLSQTLSTLDRPTSAVAWGGTALGAYAAGLLCLTRTSHDVGLGLVDYKIGSWMLLWYIVAFGFATITWS